MGQDLLIGVILLGIAAVLIFFGLPDKEGVTGASCGSRTRSFYIRLSS